MSAVLIDRLNPDFHKNTCRRGDSTLATEAHRFGKSRIVGNKEIATCKECGFTQEVLHLVTPINTTHQGGFGF